MERIDIHACDIKNIARYGEIYDAAFSGDPWNDPWGPEDAMIHIKELLESKNAYGLECVVDGEIAGFILGTSMLFHYGRTFEINDLAVSPEYQKKGIAKQLMDKLLGDIKEQGMVGVHLITAGNTFLTDFYGQYGFREEKRVILMGKDL